MCDLRRPAPGHAARAGGALRAVAAEPVQPTSRSTSLPPRPRSTVTAAISAAASPSPSSARIHDHARQPRRQRERAEARPSSVIRPSPSSAPSSAQQVARRLQRRRRRRIAGRPASRDRRFPIPRVEQHEERSARRISGWRKGRERRGLRFIPQPIADAGLSAAGAAAALIDRRARGPHGFQPRHADVGLVTRHPRNPG